MIEYGHARCPTPNSKSANMRSKARTSPPSCTRSGSTGTPKGVELTHSNFVFITYSGVSSMPDIAMKPNRRLLLFLPLAHVFARYMQFFCFAGNVSLGLSSNSEDRSWPISRRSSRRSSSPCRGSSKRYTMRRRRRPEPASRDVFSLAPPQTARDWSHAQQSGGRHSGSRLNRKACAVQQAGVFVNHGRVRRPRGVRGLRRRAA